MEFVVHCWIWCTALLHTGETLKVLGEYGYGRASTGRYGDLALLKMVVHEGANKSSRFHHDISLSTSQFMPLLPTRKLPKLLLRDPRLKPLQPRKNLRHTLRIKHIPIRLSNQRFNLRQTVTY
jgi:ABC-type microcin C transport system duplicated ATPase subunit YejF